MVAVRQAGNYDLIKRARAAFGALKDQTERLLFDEQLSWQYSIRRERGVEAYLRLLQMLGRQQEAARLRARLADR